MQLTKKTKLREWLTLGVSRPQEALDRAATVIDAWRDRASSTRPQYATMSPADVVSTVTALVSSTPQSCESQLARVEADITLRMKSVAAAPIAQIHCADITLARLCYQICRILRPEVVVETGVAYGVTSAFILEALAANGSGILHSIDLPPLGPRVDEYVGILVPEDRRDRWHLHRGATKRVLPKLIPKLGRLDMFVHDSLHTYRNLSMELRFVTPYLRFPGLVIADDVHENEAFADWVEEVEPCYSAAVREEAKEGVFGIALLKAGTDLAAVDA